MAVTKKQLAANRQNAQKSTGPVTSIGKSRVASNAVKHGVLSKKLLLPDESEEEYQQFLDQLVSSITPKGALEYSVVEKIAVNLWKQRRLIQAETAEIQLHNLPSWIASAVDSKLGHPIQSVTAEELEGLDQEYFTWCETVSTEIIKIRESNITLWTKLQPVAPTILEELQNDADEDDTNINEYLIENFESLDGYIIFIEKYCIKYHRRAEVLELATLVKQINTVLSGEKEKMHSRYQTTLNNEFHKLIATLRDLKKMQPHFIDADAITIEQ